MLRRLIILALVLAPTAAMAQPGMSNAVGHTVLMQEKTPVRSVHMNARIKPLKILHPLSMLSRVSRYGNTGEDGEITF